jgi:hypothetical protein
MLLLIVSLCSVFFILTSHKIIGIETIMKRIHITRNSGFLVIQLSLYKPHFRVVHQILF